MDFFEQLVSTTDSLRFRFCCGRCLPFLFCSMCFGSARLSRWTFPVQCSSHGSSSEAQCSDYVKRRFLPWCLRCAGTNSSLWIVSRLAHTLHEWVPHLPDAFWFPSHSEPSACLCSSTLPRRCDGRNRSFLQAWYQGSLSSSIVHLEDGLAHHGFSEGRDELTSKVRHICANRTLYVQLQQPIHHNVLHACAGCTLPL